jgi:hypothetical protein
MVDGVSVRNDIPWQFAQDYSFVLEVHAGSFRIEVYDATGALLQRWAIQDSTYTAGRFGFYNYSQAPVVYESFVTRSAPIECAAGRIDG